MAVKNDMPTTAQVVRAGDYSLGVSFSGPLTLGGRGDFCDTLRGEIRSYRDSNDFHLTIKKPA